MKICDGNGRRAIVHWLPAENGFAGSWDVWDYEPCDCPACVGIAAKKAQKSAAGVTAPSDAVKAQEIESSFEW